MTDPIRTLAGLNLLTPAAKAAMVNQFFQVTLREARSQAEQAATPADQKALSRWAQQYEYGVSLQRDHRVSTGILRDGEIATEYALRSKETAGRLAESGADLRHGALSIEEMRSAVHEAERLVREGYAEADAMDTRFTEREQLRAQDPAAFQEEFLSRVPALNGRLPALLGQLPEPVVGPYGAPTVRSQTNVNPADSVRLHAADVYAAITDAVRAITDAEARERALAGPSASDLEERVPALRGRI